MKAFKRSDLASSGYTPSCTYEIEFGGQVIPPVSGKSSGKLRLE
jgi:adenine-specific DNA-methyltransferase